MTKLIGAAAIATAFALFTTACGSGDTDTAAERSPATSTTPAHVAGDVREPALAASSTVYSKPFIRADLDKFVDSFRARYPELSSDRDNTSIENIAIKSCNDLVNGADQGVVLDHIRTYAANLTTDPLPDETGGIYDMITATCP